MRTVLITFVLLLSGPISASEMGSIVTIDFRGGHVIYEAEGKKRTLDGVIEALRNRAERSKIQPIDDAAVILTSKSVSILDVQYLYSALQAYGFREVRVFAFDARKERLQEVKLAIQVIPYTTDRAELMRAIGREK